jgi:hypothetical protein
LTAGSRRGRRAPPADRRRLPSPPRFCSQTALASGQRRTCRARITWRSRAWAALCSWSPYHFHLARSLVVFVH